MLRFINLAVFLSLFASLQAGSTGDSYDSLQGEADREIARRQEDLIVAEQELRAGDSALQQKDIASAYRHYKAAADLVPNGASGGSLRARAISRFSSASIRYAEHLVYMGEYAEARKVAAEVLEPRYNPDYKPAIAFLSHLEEADYFNKTTTPEFAARREEAGKLISEAVGFYDSGRYDLAQKRYQQVLAIDKDNAAAFRGLEQIELSKQRYYDSAYNQTRARMLWQVEKAWELPKRRFTEPRVSADVSGEEQKRGTELMVARLNSTIVDEVNLQDATVREAIAFLQRKSSSAENGDAKEINIVVELPRQDSAATTEGEVTASQFSDRITLKLNKVPLYEALRYVALQAGLKVKVEPFAVSIVPLDKQTESLEVREFVVPPGFIPAVAATQTEEEAAPGRVEASAGALLTARQNAKDFLESQGVEFPPGSSARFIAGSSRLVVKNIAQNLDLIASLVEAASSELPRQVDIEAKFVEVSQNNLKELGFDWTVGPFSIGGSGIYGGGGNSIDGANRPFPFNYPGTTVPVGQTTVTSGLRSGTGKLADSALSVNALNALLLEGLGLASSGGPAPGIFSIAGVFTNPQFQVLIRALNQKKGVDLMAAPKVTTKSGQKANIKIIREFPYPQRYQEPELPSESGAVVVGAIPSDPVVTPAFPTDFTTQAIGVEMDVMPQIGPDGYTIDLELEPRVTEFEGFVNYGSPIYAPNTETLFTDVGFTTYQTQQLLTENVINQPIFSMRKIKTNVTIWDGQTVAIGGLIREDVQQVNDKVPLLGDIPFAGALFRSEVEQKIKRNLIIFTTARLVDAEGKPLRPEEDSDQEEIVEPLGLPPEINPPRANPKGGITRK